MPLKILLSEGTSLSARETITALGRSGQRVELCVPQRWCLGSYSRWVDRVHVMPTAGADPAGYVRAVAERCARDRVDVLLPCHEQAYLFAALRARDPAWPDGRTAVPVAPFAAFAALQTKSVLAATLAAAGLPGPDTFVVQTPAELLEHGGKFLRADGACLVKADAGTASVGLRRIGSRRELEELAASASGPEEAGAPLIVQRLVPGPLERVQAVFADGRLVGAHGYRQMAAGPGGGDVLKESVSRPAVVTHLAELGARLRWRGALSFDYVLEDGDPERPRYLDANPRLVEPVNAHLAGAPLAELLVRVALGRDLGPLVIGRAGVRTRLGVQGLLERAAATGRRGPVLRDFLDQLRNGGRYAGSAEELTPYVDDPRSLIPLGGVLLTLLAQPRTAEAISRATIASYALGRRGHEFARAQAGG